MRLEPIEKPDTLYMKMAYKLCERIIGRVITPMKVVYARVPAALRIGQAINKLMEKETSLAPDLVFLLKTHTAQLNHCNFCIDIAKAMAMREHLTLDKVNALGDYRNNPIFTEAERAALDYVGQTTVDKHVSDDTFARMKEFYTDVEITEITVINAAENFYNLINIPLEIETDGLCALLPQNRAAATTTP